MPKFVDDKFGHLESDLEKVRVKHRMYISHSNELAGKSLVLEILYNAIDECRNPKSPADRIHIDFDERTGFIRVTDNGRGIPTELLEMILTTLNSGSNIDSTAKAEKGDVLGQNGAGTLAYTALAERIEVTSYRGGTEDKYLRLTFAEGKKVGEESGHCEPGKHGMEVYFKPSKILGRATRIVWSHVHDELLNLQFTEKRKIKFTSAYTDKDGKVVTETYKQRPMVDILTVRNAADSIISPSVELSFRADNINEEVGGKLHKRFVAAEVVFAFTGSLNPYLDSFSNGNNTIDGGDHFDGAYEGICRYFQSVTKASLSDREKDKLDIKWDDVRQGLSLVVSLRTNTEELYTGQTKQKVQNDELGKLVKDQVISALQIWGSSHAADQKRLIEIVKLNARVRREGEKVRSATIKDKLSVWKSYRIKNYDPCVNRGKEYKELFIIEGDSAKGSLNLARDHQTQALFAIRGVSANVFKLDLKGVTDNVEFRNLILVMGCDVGDKFDLKKLNFDKIVIATDADVDGLFIRCLLLGFFLKIFPEIIEDGRLFIAEPPLYRVNDKKRPFVINKEDYVNRYIADVVKAYQLGFFAGKGELFQPMSTGELKVFLGETSAYVEDIRLLAEHYKVNERLIEIMIHRFANIYRSVEGDGAAEAIVVAMRQEKAISSLMARIQEEFHEIYYDDEKQLITGIADGVRQSIEISERLIRKSMEIIRLIAKYDCRTEVIEMKDVKTGVSNVRPLLQTLKMLKKFQPDIVKRFKGLGENDSDDIKKTIMDPNTRMLIKINIDDLNNDMAIFSVLRGNSPASAQARRKMIREYQIPRDLIDT